MKMIYINCDRAIRSEFIEEVTLYSNPSRVVITWVSSDEPYVKNMPSVEEATTEFHRIIREINHN